MSRVKISTFVPLEAADVVRQALGQVGAGVIGDYRFCSFSVQGTGRYLPENGAKPYRGKNGIPSEEAEERIEVVCNQADAKQAVAAIKQAHPYEEPAIDIVPLIDEEDL
ncbi:hypothetical protein KDA06_01200 [Candidatus Saccharibacteria bacterium]|jgi:hypothetical protein|nr:hypothetical protein [Candidatus Saccharibacteria bacterium]HPR09508.1 hypothetical protein [Candidatus Saccharibacteria bacterium]